MKFLKKNKGILVFYLLVLVFTIAIIDNNNTIDDTSIVYVEK